MEREINKETVQITVASDVTLDGNLNIPLSPQGVILFAHGSGSSRHSGRNQFVAHILNNAGLATLLIDLLMPDEEVVDNQTRHLRFDIDMLAQRLAGTIDWLVKEDTTRSLNIGLFGASTGGGAALVAATLRASFVSAVVSRGGRPDLAGDVLANVQAPTLLIVGEEDKAVIEFNKQAIQQLRATKQLEIVPRATHLFEEPGTLETVALLARNWFLKYLAPENP
jgi:putative phosphoribosyl transferase